MIFLKDSITARMIMSEKPTTLHTRGDASPTVFWTQNKCPMHHRENSPSAILGMGNVAGERKNCPLYCQFVPPEWKNLIPSNNRMSTIASRVLPNEATSVVHLQKHISYGFLEMNSRNKLKHEATILLLDVDVLRTIRRRSLSYGSRDR